MFLFISFMLFVLTEMSAERVDQESAIGIEKRSFARLLKIVKKRSKKVKPTQQNNSSQRQRSTHLEHEFAVDNHPFRLPPDIQLQVFEHLSMTFEEAVKIASEKGASIDWAYQYHDPSKDNYAIVKEWLKMDNSDNAKDQLKEKMMLNPTLRTLFNWKGGLDPSRENLIAAVEKRNIDILKF